MKATSKMIDDGYIDKNTQERVHVPTELFPSNWKGKVWQSTPTTFTRAIRAWEAAASCVAGPYQPPHILAIALSCYRWEVPSLEQLIDICQEANRRANWLPNNQIQAIPCRKAKVWSNKTQYGLLWETSVQTILAYTEEGWVVRIIGGHSEREAAAEKQLESIHENN